MTRILWRPTALGTVGPRQTPRATCSSVCAQATAEGSGSASGMLHFTPLAWVRNDNTPVSPSCCLCREKNVNQRHTQWAGRDKRCRSEKVGSPSGIGKMKGQKWMLGKFFEALTSSDGLTLNAKIRIHYRFFADHNILRFRHRLPGDHQHSACSLPAFCDQPSPGGAVSHRDGRGVLHRPTMG